MSLVTDAPKRASAVYALPESAYIELVQMRDHARLMAQLTQFDAHAANRDASLRPDAFAWWFSRMRRDIDGILAASSLRVEVPSEPAESSGDDH